MYKALYILLFTVFALSVKAQHFQRAFLDETGNVKTEKVDAPLSNVFRSGEDGYAQVEGFPKGFIASKKNKNFRNVTLADLDGDGAEEIITAIASTLYVYEADSLIWKRGIAGLGLYPPSVVDINDDGVLDIIQLTGGNQEVGGIYVMDKDGNDLPGWPKSFDDNWLVTAPAISDLDDDGQLEIIFNELSNPRGRVQVLKNNGESFNENWPTLLDNTSGCYAIRRRYR